MQRNKIPAVVCFAFVLAIRVYQHVHGEAHAGLLVEPFILCWAAFMLPGALPVIAIEDGIFHYAPWGAGHTMTTIFYVTVVAASFWFFPTGRIMRLFGTFDAFKEGKRRPLLVRGAAHALDSLNKRLFGRARTGGWA